MKISKMSGKMIQMVGISALVFMLGGAVFYRSLAAFPFALGVLIPAALNMLKIYMLDRTVNKVVDMDDPNTGKNYVRMQYLFRYLLTGLVLLAIGLIHTNTDPPLISIWGAVAGVFTMQISVIICRSKKYDEEDVSIDSKSGEDKTGEKDKSEIADIIEINSSETADDNENIESENNSGENNENGKNNY